MQIVTDYLKRKKEIDVHAMCNICDNHPTKNLFHCKKLLYRIMCFYRMNYYISIKLLNLDGCFKQELY